MRAISVYDFNRLMKALKPHRIEYETISQDDYYEPERMRNGKDIFLIHAAYDEILVFFTPPKCIFFKTKDGANSLTIYDVKHVLIPDDLTYAHIVFEFTIVCGDSSKPDSETLFRFCAGLTEEDPKSIAFSLLPFLNAADPKE